MFKRLVIALGVFASIPMPAYACSLLDWNNYESYWESPFSELLGQAVTIDWVEVEVIGPQRCPPYSERETKRFPELPPECEDYDLPAPGMFEAHVVERLRGKSKAAFDLFMMSPAQSFADRFYPPEKFGFSDLRELYTDLATHFRQNERAIASGAHASLVYWNRGVSQFRTDGGSSCGGWRSLDPSLRYVIFRAKSGAVVALEPVTREDDVLLVRLRALRDGTQTGIRTTLSVDDYFRQTDELVLARVTKCKDDVNAAQEGLLVVKRGDAAFLRGEDRRDPFRYLQAPFALAFDDLPDYFAFRHERCPVGEDVLLFTMKMSASDPLYHFDRLVERLPPQIAYLAGLDRYPSYAPDRDFYHAQPVRVSSGDRVKLSDLQTGLNLAGPDSVSVDDIFRWHAEGRAERGGN